jgi:N-acyl-L-homoserine lactone synthetase
MMQLITSDCYGTCIDELADMHRLRYRVFKQRLDWDVEASGDMEVDEFDALKPCYLLQRSANGSVTGCVRLLPSTGPTMLRDTFGALLDGAAAPASPHIWESSRFGLDPEHTGSLASRGIAKATYELFAGMIEFGLSRGLTDIVTVTDVRMERILRRASWPLLRLGQPKAFGCSLAVAGYLPVSVDNLGRIRAAGQLKGPALWSPVTPLAA